MLHCIVKWGEGNHVKDVSRFYLKLHGGLDRCLSYKVSFQWCYIPGCQCRKPLEYMIISKAEHPDLKCAYVYISYGD